MKETAYLLQAALIGAWWAGLASSREFFAAFQFSGITSAAFWSFLLPDLILIAGLSILRAYRKNSAIEYVILGAIGYATLYCCNATAITGSGFLPTGLMLLGLAYNGFLCFEKFVFRPSSSGLTRNALKTLLQIISTWVLALVVVPYVIMDAFGSVISIHGGTSLYLGGALFVCFSLLGLSSAFYMVRDGAGTPLPLDQTNRLVTTGPYQFVRNPMVIAGIGQGISISILLQSIPVLVYSLLGILVWQVVVRPVEERDMLERFGDAYADYRNRVSCWIPTRRRDATWR